MSSRYLCLRTPRSSSLAPLLYRTASSRAIVAPRIRSDEDEEGRNASPPRFPMAALPPPVPDPVQITHYHVQSAESRLCHSLLLEASDKRGGRGELSPITNRYPLAFDLTFLDKGEEPTPTEWQEIREMMLENAREKSYLSKDSSILITALDDPESKIPKRFFPPMVINWSDRRVCYGPLLFAELETMVKEMKEAHMARLQAEELYDAELRRLKLSPIKRAKPIKDPIPLWEFVVCAFIAACGVTYWTRSRPDKEMETRRD